MARTVAVIMAAIEAAKIAHLEVIKCLNDELAQAQKAIRFECDACHRAVKVGDATVIQHLEFRCPGQTGGYFINSHRQLKCPHCGGTTNPYNQPEVDALPNASFKNVVKVED